MVSIFNNIDLKKYNTFGISAKCKTLVEYSCVNDLVDFLKSDYSHDTPLLHIGGGSNLVFTKDFDGVILHSAILGKEVVKDCDKVRVKVGAGEKLDDFINWCVKNEYYGLENNKFICNYINLFIYKKSALQFITARLIKFIRVQKLFFSK
mgnify:CR=1 FL=1